ncbi:MAG TPA: hypothetical protein VFH51_20705 [Myxococcota bacterium]|nr:hypothetical protein [Myxococcota bacterium]
MNSGAQPLPPEGVVIESIPDLLEAFLNGVWRFSQDLNRDPAEASRVDQRIKQCLHVVLPD